jgi:hypothetical protein
VHTSPWRRRNFNEESKYQISHKSIMIELIDEAVSAASPNTTTHSGRVNQEPPAMRRKVRKGTKSCWECKRRKARCIFASDHATCVGCQRRRTACVSQEMPEELSPARIGNRHLGERISRVEDIMNELLPRKVDDSDLAQETRPHVSLGRASSEESTAIQDSSGDSSVSRSSEIEGISNCQVDSK